jgi:hypothetical protein
MLDMTPPEAKARRLTPEMVEALRPWSPAERLRRIEALAAWYEAKAERAGFRLDMSVWIGPLTTTKKGEAAEVNWCGTSACIGGTAALEALKHLPVGVRQALVNEWRGTVQRTVPLLAIRWLGLRMTEANELFSPTMARNWAASHGKRHVDAADAAAALRRLARGERPWPGVPAYDALSMNETILLSEICDVH